MPTTFSRTMRSLEGDGFRANLFVLALGTLLLAGWLGWFLLSRVALYEVTGQIVRNHMVLGGSVVEGDLLMELDADGIKFEVQEKRAQAAGLTEQLDRLRRQMEAQDRALGQARSAESSATEEARARSEETHAAASFAEAEARRMADLHEEGLVSKARAEGAEAEARQRHAAAEALERSVERQESDRRFEQSEKEAELSALSREMAELEAALRSLEAVEARLEHELQQHLIRAPVAGSIGDLVTLKVGDVVTESQRLGTVMPEGEVRVVAEFAPHQALGRIRPGQSGRLRLRGFSWVQYGSIAATVTQVAGNALDGYVRVELALDDTPGLAIPLDHGLPGTLEVEVERLTPAALVLRAAGNTVSRTTNGSP